MVDAVGICPFDILRNFSDGPETSGPASDTTQAACGRGPAEKGRED